MDNALTQVAPSLILISGILNVTVWNYMASMCQRLRTKQSAQSYMDICPERAEVCVVQKNELVIFNVNVDCMFGIFRLCSDLR